MQTVSQMEANAKHTHNIIMDQGIVSNGEQTVADEKTKIQNPFSQNQNASTTK